ncbi:hypothetical protein PRUPE_1G117100 [Prunus persica]|uniref:Uncharacterized protein n=1 Tax=Prunus persica TaxID=3760 RepID=A0A251QWD0_PRUPE|nr:hypothetical protein PRUPE_1G117100 [Prunus persica]
MPRECKRTISTKQIFALPTHNHPTKLFNRRQGSETMIAILLLQNIAGSFQTYGLNKTATVQPKNASWLVEVLNLSPRDIR